MPTNYCSWCDVKCGTSFGLCRQEMYMGQFTGKITQQNWFCNEMCRRSWYRQEFAIDLTKENVRYEKAMPGLIENAKEAITIKKQYALYGKEANLSYTSSPDAKIVDFDTLLLASDSHLVGLRYTRAKLAFNKSSLQFEKKAKLQEMRLNLIKICLEGIEIAMEMKNEDITGMYSNMIKQIRGEDIERIRYFGS